MNRSANQSKTLQLTVIPVPEVPIRLLLRIISETVQPETVSREDHHLQELRPASTDRTPSEDQIHIQYHQGAVLTDPALITKAAVQAALHQAGLTAAVLNQEVLTRDLHPPPLFIRIIIFRIIRRRWRWRQFFRKKITRPSTENLRLIVHSKLKSAGKVLQYIKIL